MQFRKLALPLLLTFFLLSCAPGYNRVERKEYGGNSVSYSKRYRTEGATIIDKHYYDKGKDDSLDVYEEFDNFGGRYKVKRGEKGFGTYEREFEDVVKEYEEQEKKK